MEPDIHRSSACQSGRRCDTPWFGWYNSLKCDRNQIKCGFVLSTLDIFLSRFRASLKEMNVHAEYPSRRDASLRQALYLALLSSGYASATK